LATQAHDVGVIAYQSTVAYIKQR